jgi:hypothetical protein
MAYKKASFQMTVGPTRLAFPKLFTPEAVKLNGVPKGDPIYSARLVFEPDCPVLARIDAEMKRISAEAWPDGRYPNSFWWPVQQGSQASPNDPNVQGKVIINTSTSMERPPEVYTVTNHGGQMMPIPLPKDEQFKVFSGCEAFVNVGFYTFSNSANDGGIGVGLNIVYLTGRDVGRFDARVSAAAGLVGISPDAFSFGPQAPVPVGVPGPEQGGFPGPAAGPQGSFPGPAAGPQGGFPGAGPNTAFNAVDDDIPF